ncbi:MAG: hypothetical protein Q9165_000179 [Trypethelium subeluteriae]
MTTQKFWTEDLCVLKKDPSRIGVVERTHGDVETHDPRPERDFPGGIDRDKSVKRSVYNDFLTTGVPPPGHCLVVWNIAGQVELIREDRLKLLDRSLLLGDIVKKEPHDPMSGTVISTSTTVDIACLGRVADDFMAGRLTPCARDGAPRGPLDTPSLRFPSQRRSYLENKVMRNMPLEELTSIHDYLEGDIIIHENWVGRVEEAIDEVAIRLSNGSVVVPENSDELEKSDLMVDRFNIGDLARTKKGNLRRGWWKYGAYDANIDPVGLVVEVRTIALSVTWLCQRIDVDATFPEPSEYLEEDVLESGKVRIYDRTRRPPSSDGDSSLKVQGANIHVGEIVKFKDLAGACVKYQPKSEDGPGIVRVPRTSTLGYDLNVFEIISGHTEVVVQWQDMTVTKHSSISLFPDVDLDDENSAWPGEIICSNEGKTLRLSGEDPPPRHNPDKVGVVQKVNARDRTAQVRWFSHPDVTFTYIGDDPNSHLWPDSKTGVVEGPEEEVSLYEVQSPTALNKRRGDLVVLKRSEDGPLPGAERPDDTKWVGEIIEQGLDGLLTIRLGALDTVQDVKVPVENTILAYSNEMDDLDYEDEDDMSEEDSEYLEDEEEDAEMDDAPSPFLSALSGSVNGTVILADDYHELRDETIYFEHPTQSRIAGAFRNGRLFDSDMEDVTEEEDRTRAEEDGEDDKEGEGEWTSTDDSDENSNVDSESEASEEKIVSTNNDTPMTDVEPNEAFPKKPDPSNLSSNVSPPQPPTTQPSASTSQPALSSTLILDLPSLPNAPPSFAILSDSVPSTHHYARTTPAAARSIRHITKEHSILASSLPSGIYVRTWESRLDLLRILLIGPLDTPYELAPFVIDLWMGPSFPSHPPEMFFHSWSASTTVIVRAPGDGSIGGSGHGNDGAGGGGRGTGGMGGTGGAGAGLLAAAVPPTTMTSTTTAGPGGAVNPNLYESGKICLSLLGTWHADSGGEAWSPGKSTVLQILVSLLGLVLVREPYYNEAGYETRLADPASALPSALYTERTYFRTRAFIAHALSHAEAVAGVADIVIWLYRSDAEGAPHLLDRAIAMATETIMRSEKRDKEAEGADEIPRDGLRRCSLGALVLLKRAVARLEGLRGADS